MHTPESYYFGALKRALEGDLQGAYSFLERAEEAREYYGYSFSETVSGSFPYVEEAVTTLLSSYDFTRCVRPNGTSYGSRGKCRKGTQQAKTEEVYLNPKSSLLDQADHPATFNKKVPAELLSKMSDKDIQIRRKYLKGVGGGYIGYSKDVEAVEREVAKRGIAPKKRNENLLDPKKSLLDQADHPATFNKKVPAELLSKMSDKDIQIRRKYLKDVGGGYIGYSKDVEAVERELQGRG